MTTSTQRPHLQLTAAEIVAIAMSAVDVATVQTCIAEFDVRIGNHDRILSDLQGRNPASYRGRRKSAVARRDECIACLAALGGETGEQDMPDDFDVDAVQANVEADVAVQTFAFIRDCKTLKEALEVVRAVRTLKS